MGQYSVVSGHGERTWGRLMACFFSFAFIFLKKEYIYIYFENIFYLYFFLLNFNTFFLKIKLFDLVSLFDRFFNAPRLFLKRFCFFWFLRDVVVLRKGDEQL